MTWAYQPLLPASIDKKSIKRLSSVDFAQSAAIRDTSSPNFVNRMSAYHSNGTCGVITYGSGLEVRQVTLSGLTPVYTTASVPGNVSKGLYYVKFINDKFYLFSDGMGVYSSSNGIDWSVVRADSSGFTLYFTRPMVACNSDGSIWIAQSNNSGEIFRSTDLVNWSTISGIASTFSYSIIWDGTQFVAATDTYSIYTSSDGISWSLQSTSVGNFIAFANGTYVASFNDIIKTSTDLISWSTAYTLTSALNTNVSALDLNPLYFPGGGSLFFISDYSGKSALSYDAITWYDLDTSGSANDFGSPGACILIGQTLIYKGSGTNVLKVYPELIWQTLEGARLKRSNGYDFSTMSSQAYSITGTNANVGTVRANADQSIAMTTGSGAYVNMVKSLAKNSYSNVLVSGLATGVKALEFYDDSFYIVDPTLAVYKSSDDGANWTNIRSSSTTLALASTKAENSTINADGSVWIIIANTNGSYYRSTDLGLNWSLELITGYAGTLKIDSITFANSLFLACLDGDVYTSSDALTWTQYSPSFTAANINYAFGYYFATTGASLYRSTDLSSWSGPYTRPAAPQAARLLSGTVEGQNCLWAFNGNGACDVSFDLGVTWSTLTGNTTGGAPGLSTQSCMLDGLPFAMGFASVMYVAFVKYPLIEWINLSDKLNYYDGSIFNVVDWDPVEARPLDNYTAGLWGVFSVYRKLISSYTGPAIRVKRSLDNGEEDIPFATNRLDQDFLERFLAGSSGYIVRIYDQFSNKDLTATSGREPELSITNPGLEFANFDAVDNQFVSSNIGSGLSALTFFMKGSLNSTTGQVLIETSDSYSVNNDTLAVYYLIAEGSMNVATHGTATTFARSSYGDIRLNNNIHTYRIDRAASGAVNQCSLFVDGVIQSRTGNADFGTISGTFANLPLRIGARGSGSITLASDLEMFDLCVYSTAISNDMVYNISQNLIKYSL